MAFRQDIFHTMLQCSQCKHLTFHLWLQGDVHVTQIPIAAFHHQLSSWWAFTPQGPSFITHNAALLEE